MGPRTTRVNFTPNSCAICQHVPRSASGWGCGGKAADRHPGETPDVAVEIDRKWGGSSRARRPGGDEEKDLVSGLMPTSINLRRAERGANLWEKNGRSVWPTGVPRCWRDLQVALSWAQYGCAPDAPLMSPWCGTSLGGELARGGWSQSEEPGGP